MKSRITGRKGRTFAGFAGGLVLALASSVFLSIYYPGSSFDRMFLGGLFFGPAWVGAGLFAYYAPTNLKAWLRVMIPALIFIGLNVLGLMNP